MKNSRREWKFERGHRPTYVGRSTELKRHCSLKIRYPQCHRCLLLEDPYLPFLTCLLLMWQKGELYQFPSRTPGWSTHTTPQRRSWRATLRGLNLNQSPQSGTVCVLMFYVPAANLTPRYRQRNKENVTELQEKEFLQQKRSQKCAMCYHQAHEPFLTVENMLNFKAKGPPNLLKAGLRALGKAIWTLVSLCTYRIC